MNIPEGLTVFMLPESQRKKLRSTNMVERLNKEIKRRTQVATLFPNEASLLRLVSSILVETSEEWETGRVCLTAEENQKESIPLTPTKKTNPSEGINQEKNGRDPLGGTDFILDLYTNEVKKLVG